MVPLDLPSGVNTRTKFIATTLEAMTCCVLLLEKLLFNKYQGSYRINGARTYNTLLGNIRQTETLSEFKIKLKRYLRQ